MVVVDKYTSGRDQAVISDLNPPLNIELDASPNEDAIPYYNVGPRLPIPIKLKIDIRFKNTLFPDH